MVFMMVLCAPIMAQKTKAVLIFKDGTQKEGFARLNQWEKIKFRKEEKAKKESYTFEQVNTLKLFEDNSPAIYAQVKN